MLARKMEQLPSLFLSLIFFLKLYASFILFHKWLHSIECEHKMSSLAAVDSQAQGGLRLL